MRATFRKHGPKSLTFGVPNVPIPDPVMITGEPGDVILTHYQMAHCAAPNVSPHIRYAVIYRLYHVRRPDDDPGMGDALTDIWKEWEGLSELTGR